MSLLGGLGVKVLEPFPIGIRTTILLSAVLGVSEMHSVYSC